jgi:ubiquinone/menaquinone biosynthesis C-methylase UbiE
MPDPLKIYKALADETRLRLMRLLQRSALNVNEVVEIMGMGQSRISRHLRILADAELVSFRREGTWVYYQASDSTSELVAGALDQLARFEEQLPHTDRDLQALERAIERRRETTRRFFDSISEPAKLPEHQNLSGDFYRHTAADLAEKTGTLLDMGTGAGLLLPALLQKADTIIAVDSSATMLDMASKSLNGQQQRCDFRLGDLEHLPVADGEVDEVMACMVLHHLSAPAKAIAEARRALRPGGRLVLVDLHRHTDESLREKMADLWLGFEPEEVRGWLEENDFAIVGADVVREPGSLELITFLADKKGKDL